MFSPSKTQEEKAETYEVVRRMLSDVSTCMGKGYKINWRLKDFVYVVEQVPLEKAIEMEETLRQHLADIETHAEASDYFKYELMSKGEVGFELREKPSDIYAEDASAVSCAPTELELLKPLFSDPYTEGGFEQLKSGMMGLRLHK